MMRLVWAALVLVPLLAGCAEEQVPGPVQTPAPTSAVPALSGFVLDEAVRPLADVEVRILETDANTTTDAQGRYAFTQVPRSQTLVLVASREGYKAGSKQVSMPSEGDMRLDFTLASVPLAVPHWEVLDFNGFLACRVGTDVQGQNNSFGCGAGSQEADTWDFAVGPDLAGAVIEVYWAPTTEAGASLKATLETLELGEYNLVLGEALGESPLRIPVPQSTAQKYYAAGGLMRLTLSAAPNNDENEAGVGASVAFQQAFEAYASLFYVQPPPTTYTVADA